MNINKNFVALYQLSIIKNSSNHNPDQKPQTFTPSLPDSATSTAQDFNDVALEKHIDNEESSTSHSLHKTPPCNEHKIDEAKNLNPPSQEKDDNNLSNVSKGYIWYNYYMSSNYYTSIDKLLEEHISDISELLSKDANKAFQSSFIKKSGIKEFYIFKFKNLAFLLILGQTITLSGWNLKIKETIENIINQVYNKVENVGLIDHTYAQGENSRRLHSLGGGLRRILFISKAVEKYRKSLIDSSKKNVSTKTKTIIKELTYNVLLGDYTKLRKQLFAVENNTKLNDKKELTNTEQIEDVSQFVLFENNLIRYVKNQLYKETGIVQETDLIKGVKNRFGRYRSKLERKAKINCQNIYK